MRAKTSVKAGKRILFTGSRNHNEAAVRVPSLRVKTSVKAGSFPPGPT
jgi:hypothetical protein